jgi:hypothetical protein
MVASKKVVLTDRYLKSLKWAPAGKRVMVWDAVQPHLGVRVTDRGQSTFVVVNHGGRSRMNADSTLRDEYFPRGMVISSGEDVPKGDSLRSRMFLHRAEKTDIDLSVLSRLQATAASGLMAESMASYVQWLAGNVRFGWRVQRITATPRSAYRRGIRSPRSFSDAGSGVGRSC